MNGFDRLREQMKNQENAALKQTVDYLLSCEDMEPNYLKVEKTIEGMCNFIRSKSEKHSMNGWNYITNEIVFSWAIMYFSLPDELLQITNFDKKPKAKKSTITQKENTKNNVVSLEKAKQEIEKKKEITQLSLFGGVAQ